MDILPGIKDAGQKYNQRYDAFIVNTDSILQAHVSSAVSAWSTNDLRKWWIALLIYKQTS